MINVVNGNVLSLTKGILVHGCNCQGAMGSGIAGQIREKWPQVYEDYKFHELMYGLSLGDVIYTRVDEDLIIASALTQDKYGGPKSAGILFADYDAIDIAFQWIKVAADNTDLPVHFPLIGCGLANGVWEQVGPRIESALGPDIKKTLWIYPGNENPYENQ